jgi:hypothetical protein
LSRHKKPLIFETNAEYGREENSLLINAHDFLRNESSFINLIAKYVYDNQTLLNQKNENEKSTDINPYVKSEDLLNLTDDLYVCLKEYKKRYNNRFVLISIIASREINSKLDAFCKESDINFMSEEINCAKYKLLGWGHLTDEGNKLLGELLFKSFEKYNSK